MPAGARVDNLHAVSNGVDLGYFAPRIADGAAGSTLVFTGVMDYWPNVQGVQWFADEVLPRIHESLPGVTLQALAYEAIVQDRMVQRTSPAVIWIVALVLAGLAGARFSRWSWRRSLVCVVAAGAILVALLLLD